MLADTYPIQHARETGKWCLPRVTRLSLVLTQMLTDTNLIQNARGTEMWCLPGVRSLSLGLLAGHRFGLCQDPVGHSSRAPTTFLKSLQKERKEKFTLFSNHDGSLLTRQPGARKPANPNTQAFDSHSGQELKHLHNVLHNAFLLSPEISEFKF